jgi:ribosome-binding protein aMBF1 (putative translation factor)
MTINKTIKSRREQLGLSRRDLAERTGISTSEYYDIEAYEDEIVSTTLLKELRRIFGILQLDALAVLGIQCPICQSNPDALYSLEIPRNQVVANRREAVGLSRQQLANKIGFDEATVQRMEVEPEFFENWAIEPIKAIADALNLPIASLLRIRCQVCGFGEER